VLVSTGDQSGQGKNILVYLNPFLLVSRTTVQFFVLVPLGRDDFGRVPQIQFECRNIRQLGINLTQL